MTDALTDRQRTILGIIVRAYIKSAAPISSKIIVEDFGLGWSAATVRNEMAALEELGYLTHPHTSAGRLPTIKGYRYFVENLMEAPELPLDGSELSVRTDKVSIEYRRWLGQLVQAVGSGPARVREVLFTDR